MGKKRTYKPRKKAEGLGDTIEQITEATGVKAVVEAVSEALDVDCGCEKRKELLNKLIKYRKKVECFSDEHLAWFKKFKETNKGRINLSEQRMIARIYFQVFDSNIQNTSCASCWRGYIADLTKVYNKQIELNNEENATT